MGAVCRHFILSWPPIPPTVLRELAAASSASYVAASVAQTHERWHTPTSIAVLQMGLSLAPSSHCSMPCRCIASPRV